MTISASVAVLGSINLDVVMNVHRFARSGETAVATALARHPGGKGANQAVAATRAGANVTLIGAVGDDADGRMLTASLENAGIDCSRVQVIDGSPTGTAYVLVDDSGENQIVVSVGANGLVGPVDAVHCRVHLTQLESPLNVIGDFLRQRAPGSIGILNAAPYRADARSIFPTADIIVLNETELSGYYGSHVEGASRAQVADMARSLISRSAQRVIVTLGAQGFLNVNRDGVQDAPGRPVPVVDTTGAGDCFCGYFAAELAAGALHGDAAIIAQRAASLSVGRRGAMPSMPLRIDLAAAK